MTEKNRKKIKVRIKSVSEPDPEPVSPPAPEPEDVFEDKPYIPPPTPPQTPQPTHPPENNVADEIEEIKRQQSNTNFKLNLLVVALTAVGLFCGRGCIRKLIH